MKVICGLPNVVGSDEFSGQTIDFCKSVRDRFSEYKSGTIPELPGQVEGMLLLNSFTAQLGKYVRYCYDCFCLFCAVS